MSTWNSTSTGRSSVSTILDENDTSDLLVYKYRIGGPRLEISSAQSLCKLLRGGESAQASPSPSFPTDRADARCPCTEPRYRVSKKAIPRGNSRVDVRMEDILTDEERSVYGDKPNRKSSVASVGLPSSVYWKRLLFNDFQDLYIVSTFSSPDSTPNQSPESSQHVRPSDSFPRSGEGAEPSAAGA